MVNHNVVMDGGGGLDMLGPNLVYILSYLRLFRGNGHFIVQTHDGFHWFSINHQIFW